MIKPQEYYEIVHTALTVTSKVISHDVDMKNYNGRKGSLEFEDNEVKSYIRKHYSTIISEVNDALEEGATLIRIEAEENDDESSQRSMEDILVVFSYNDEDGQKTYEVPVNIKCVKGGKYDNTGGWEALNFVLFGGSTGEKTSRKKKNAVINRILEEDISNKPHDYFLWIFFKTLESNKVISDSAVFSLVGSDLAAITVNASQSFPLQFSASKSEIDYTSIQSEEDLLQRRKDLVKKIAENMYKKGLSQTVLWGQVLEKSDDTQSRKRFLRQSDVDLFASSLSNIKDRSRVKEVLEEEIGVKNYQKLSQFFFSQYNTNGLERI